MADPSTPNGPSLPCPQCQTPLPAGALFCLRCGTRLSTPAPAAAVAPAPARPLERSGTLVGVSPDALAPPSATPLAAAGTTVPDGSAQGPTIASPRRVVNQHATMMGVSKPSGAAPTTTAPAPATPAPGATPNRGGTLPGLVPAQTPNAAVPPSAAPTPAARTGQTMQGVPFDAVNAAAQAAISATGRHRRDIIVGSNIAETSAPNAAAQPEASSAMTTFDDAVPGARRSGAVGFGAIFGGLMLVVLGAGGVWWFVSRRPAPEAATLTATVRTDPSGTQHVSVTIPNAAAGTKVRAEGTERALDAQQTAELPVRLPPGRVGTHDVPIEIVGPDGVSQRRVLRILVAWRAETDLRKLGEDPPRIHVVFHVTRGSSLWIAGQPIRVSGETGIAELPSPAPAPPGEGDATRRERFPVRVVLPDGRAIEEQYELRVPRTPLRVQEPAPVLLTNQASVVVRGSAAHATRVRVGAQAATITGDTFSALVPVNAGSNSLDVVAWSPDGAPSLVNLTVYRDVTPEAYLSTGGGDRGVQGLIARPIVPGTRVRLTGGLIADLSAPGEQPTWQLVVENAACPSRRCTALVRAPAAATLSVGMTVDVVGELRGERAYSTQAGERRSDPVVQAIAVTRRRP